MGKQGPCYHCGVTSTPLWRNGPPEKPVLCNACGSRWRTKGTLANYTPLHARTDLDDYEDHKGYRLANLPANKSPEDKMFKRKQNHSSGSVEGFMYDYNHIQRKGLDEDASNRSSSGSAISNSESCAQFGSADCSDLTGPSQSVVWDSMVPSRKRTCFTRPKPSPVEKLTKDLHTILNEQQSYCFSGSSEEDLIFDSETPMVSVEIGHGSVLIRHPSSIARDEESEASSLSVDNKHSMANEAYSYPFNPPQKHPEGDLAHGSNVIMEKGHDEQFKRDKCLNDIKDLLGDHYSPLCDIDLNDLLNFEEFGRQLSNQEQQQLLKYLPPIDGAKLPESVKALFECPQFKECLSSYQQLLAEGVYDGSLPETRDNDFLKGPTASKLSNSKWIEHYNHVKNSTGPTQRPTGRGSNVAFTKVGSAKISRECQSQIIPEARAMKSPYGRSTEIKDNFDVSAWHGGGNLFAFAPQDNISSQDLLLVEESSDQDLLLDVPSNGPFAQAELLNPINNCISKESGGSVGYPHLVRPWP